MPDDRTASLWADIGWADPIEAESIRLEADAIAERIGEGDFGGAYLFAAYVAQCERVDGRPRSPLCRAAERLCSELQKAEDPAYWPELEDSWWARRADALRSLRLRARRGRRRYFGQRASGRQDDEPRGGNTA